MQSNLYDVLDHFQLIVARTVSCVKKSKFPLKTLTRKFAILSRYSQKVI